MRILINTLSISSDKGGVKTYLKNITTNLIMPNGHTDFVLLCSKSSYSIFKFLEDNQNVELLSLPISTKSSFFRIFLEQFILPVILFLKFKSSKTVLITPSSIATIFSPIPQMLIVQSPLAIKTIRNELPPDFLKDLSAINKIYYDSLLPISLVRSDTIIAVSGYLKDKMIELKEDTAEKIKVVYEGVETSEFKKKAGVNLEEPYILFVSTLFRYKNADRIIKAFGKLASEKEIPKECRLKIIGRDPTDGAERDRLQKLSREYQVENRVDFLGYVQHDQIANYYQHAYLFVYPSSVETFGLPPLEAMASGTPVIASNRMSVPEVVGDAGIIVDPDEIESMAQSIKKLFKDQQLYEDLKKKGYNRITDFTWEKAADNIYKECNKLVAN